MPPKIQTHVTFRKYERQVKLPFIIYVHFESLQVPKPRTKATLLHKPCGFGYSLKCSYDDKLSKYKEYFGQDSPEVFWQTLENDVEFIKKELSKEVEHQVLNDEEKRIFNMLTKCYFCAKDLYHDKCEDFDMLTGKFVGAAHFDCKNRSKIPDFVPVVMHNFSKYARHFLLDVLNKNEIDKLFPPNSDIGFVRKIDNFRVKFIDSKRFMDETIEDLQDILADSKKHKLRKEFPKLWEFELMKKKLYFPHCYIDSFEKFTGRELPPKSDFCDRLHDEELSQKNYQIIEDVWKNFHCEKLSDYFSYYLQSNVFILEDIFENFRNLCVDKFSLDPVHYFTVAGFSWDAMLKYTNVNLELLQDKDMIYFIKSNIRGGIVQCSKRHSKANHMYSKKFDRSKASNFIVYLDANNLGGWAMSQKLPFSNFRWLNKSEVENFDISQLPDDDSDVGYFLEVDLDYPQELHKLHNDLPFCSQFLTVPPPPISQIAALKPVLSLYPKKKYGIDYRVLRQCLENGLILKKIHRILKFHQCRWLEPYISYNTYLRAEAKNDFESKLYKLLNNSVFGKTIEKTSTEKPIYAGFSILDLSKKFMYDFHYKVMLKKYKNKITLLYIDTDGVIYEIQTKDFFKDVREDPDFLKLLDTSNLDSCWDIPLINRKTLGKMKNEYGSKILEEFFGVGGKFYFLDVEGEEVKKAVGMKKYVKQKYINREDYEKCVLYDEKIKRFSMETTPDGHKIQSKPTFKAVLSPGDRKRCILPDKVNTVAWGFKLTK